MSEVWVSEVFATCVLLNYEALAGCAPGWQRAVHLGASAPRRAAMAGTQYRHYQAPTTRPRWPAEPQTFQSAVERFSRTPPNSYIWNEFRRLRVVRELAARNAEIPDPCEPISAPALVTNSAFAD